MLGNVHVRWVDTLERMNKVLKLYVMNLASAEATITNCYIIEEKIGYKVRARFQTPTRVCGM